MNYLKYTNYDKEPGGIKKLNFVLNTLKKKKKAKILDLGCGYANVSFPLAYLGYNVLATDLSRRLIKENSKKNKFKNLKFKNLNLNNNNLKIKTKFDVILCLDVLEHLEYPEQLLKKINKLLKKKGILIISIPNGYGFSELFSRFFRSSEKLLKFNYVNKIKNLIGGYNIQSQDYTPHLQKYTYKKLIKIMKDKGFKQIEQKNSTIFCSTLRFGKSFEKIDCLIADKVFKKISSGWYITFKKTKNLK